MMRKTLLPLAAILLVGGAIGGATAADRATKAASDEAKLAKELAGLTPGKPTDCLGTREGSNTRLTAIGSKLLYRVNRGFVYVNQTTGGCEGVARGDAIVTRSVSRLCRGDIAQTIHFPASVPTGGCALGEFTPYKKG